MNFFRNKKSDEPVSVEAAHSAATDTPRKWRVTKAGLFGGIASVLVTGSLGAAAYFYTEYKKVTEVRTPQAEVESLVASISEHFELPSGETPTLATVTDREQLSGQEFFVSAQNGDKVLLYQEWKKAILFRPSTGKIVNVAPINVAEPTPAAPEAVPVEQETVAGAETASESASAEDAEEPEVPAEPARIALYNGTSKVGITGSFEKEFLADDTTSFEVVLKENAAREDYEATVVVDITNEQTTRAQELAKQLGVELVSGVPDGETAPDADILVILGADRLK